MAKQKNNGKQRRAAKAAGKVEGKKAPYNALATRAEKRALMGAFVVCEHCGDRMMRRNLAEHVRKARLHA